MPQFEESKCRGIYSSICGICPCGVSVVLFYEMCYREVLCDMEAENCSIISAYIFVSFR